MTMQILAILALLIWVGSFMVCLDKEPVRNRTCVRIIRSILIGFVVTLVIFVVTGTVLALATIAFGGWIWVS